MGNPKESVCHGIWKPEICSGLAYWTYEGLTFCSDHYPGSVESILERGKRWKLIAKRLRRRYIQILGALTIRTTPELEGLRDERISAVRAWAETKQLRAAMVEAEDLAEELLDQKLRILRALCDLVDAKVALAAEEPGANERLEDAWDWAFVIAQGKVF